MFRLIMKCITLAGMFCICHVAQSQVRQAPGTSENKWWKEAIVYQLYPRSFKDSDGDGIGDLKGVISKLDYLKSLNIDVVWFNPIYASPNDDNGYDISNYREIMSDFGTMEDFNLMLSEMHKRNIKVVMDLVVNHSSDEHEFFKQSRSSRSNPYRNYYHWWNAERGKPNPRYSFFDINNDAWLYDSLTNAYYLHYFSRKQPDLNWENPRVRQEVHDIMKFWLDKGVDGFRMDAFQFVAKDTTFPRFPEGYEKHIIKYYGMGPNIHDYLKEMNSDVLSKYDIMTVAEGAGSSFEDAHALVDPDRNELNMVYHFEGMDIGNDPKGYSLLDFKRVYTRWDSAFAKKGWLSIFLANHDVPRMVSKFGNDDPRYREASSKMLTTFIMSMRGTPYYYNGDEIGMTNARFKDIKDYRDIATINRYNAIKNSGGDLDQFIKQQQFISRDNSRTPFQWNDSSNAGFTKGKPWIKVNPNYKKVNEAAQEKDPNSVLNYFRKITLLRKENPVLVYGNYELLDETNKQVYAYTRSLNNKKVLVLLNFSKEKTNFVIPGTVGKPGQVMINNLSDFTIKQQSVHLQPYQALIINLE